MNTFTQKGANSMQALSGTLDFKTLREARGLTQVELGMLARSSEGMVNKIERYHYIPGYPIRRRFARVLGVEMTDIWPGLNDEDYE
jgi:transcriptional regulator with XRE-family HTH domain